MIDYSLCELGNMNIEIGGISIINIKIEPANDEKKVNLKRPITHTVSEGFNGFTVTAYLKAFRRSQECRILNGLIR